MERLKSFLGPPTALAEQQALSWIAKMTGGELSRKQEGEFAVWLSLQGSHRRLFDGLIDIWELTGELSPAAQQRITQATDQAESSQTKSTSVAPPPQPAVHNAAQGWLANLRPAISVSGTPVLRFSAAFSAVTALVLVWASLNT